MLIKIIAMAIMWCLLVSPLAYFLWELAEALQTLPGIGS